MPEITDKTRKPLEFTSRRKDAVDLSTYAFGKIPPQARDLEEAVLGAMMLETDAVSTVIDILRPESFYFNAHQLIFEAIHNLFHKSQPVDILTVTAELKKMGKLEDVGGPFFITDLTNRIASAANVESHARIVSQKYIQRELIKISSEIIKDSYEDTTDVFELLDKAEQNLFTVTEKNLKRNSESMSNLLSKAIRQIESIKNHKDSLIGVPSGFTDLDRVTAGWQKSDLIIAAARPGMGKTAFVLSIARNAAIDHNRPVAIFSLEMSNIQLVNRLISAETELPSEKLRRGNLEAFEWQQLTVKSDKLAEAPIFIDDTPAINIFELRAKCRRLKMHHKVELFIVDYLQLMSGTADGKHGNREQEISNISRAMKSIAKELDTPFIALSQLSRAVETRGGSKRPQLSDLRESGAIEQDADLVLFLYRPEYYQLTEDENGNSTRGIAEVIIAKHRNGPLQSVFLRFVDKYAKFIELENELFEHPRPVRPLTAEESGSITKKSGNWDKKDDDDDATPF